MNYKQATPTNGGLYRIYGKFDKYDGITNPARVWIGTAEQYPLKEDTIIKLKDAHGNTDEVLAGTEGLQFG